MASVLSVSSRALLDACRRLGIDTHRVLEAARLDAAALDDPDARIPIEQVQILWQTAYELSADPVLSLHAIEVLPFGAYRVLDLLAASAPTIGTALAKVSDYFPLINSVVRLPYAVGAAEVSVCVEAPSRPSAVTRAYAEYTLAAVFLRTRAATKRRYALRRVEFAHRRPPDTREHERLFECAVAFDAAETRLVLAREVWDAPCDGEGTLFSVLDEHARLLLEQLPAPDGVVDRVRQAIDAELRGGRPELATVARRLAVSARSLQRQLKEHGARFEELVDVMRFRSAKAYLAQRDIAVSEIAYLLGFADQSAFNRAFKRWSRVTPTEFRRGVRL